MGVPDDLIPAQFPDCIEGKLHRWSVEIDALGTTLDPAGQLWDAMGASTSIWAWGIHRFQGCALHFDDEFPTCVVSDRQSEAILVMDETVQNLGWPQADVDACTNDTCDGQRKFDFIVAIHCISSACPTIGMVGIGYRDMMLH